MKKVDTKNSVKSSSRARSSKRTKVSDCSIEFRGELPAVSKGELDLISAFFGDEIDEALSLSESRVNRRAKKSSK